MTAYPPEVLEPTYIRGTEGHLFCILAKPSQPQASTRTVLLVPPFAEELNASRRFFSMLRRALCHNGFTVIQPDLYGTGDSEGLFGEATWEIWLGDLLQVYKHFFRVDVVGDGKRDCSDDSLSVIALRSGCLLAQEFLIGRGPTADAVQVEKLLYLQPETSGFNVINTLLRMRVANTRLSNKRSETGASLWQRFEQQQGILLAGYDVSHKLALQMRDTSLNVDIALPVIDQHWINLGQGTGEALAGGEWREHSVPSTNFWQAHDIEPDNDTVDGIVALLNA